MSDRPEPILLSDAEVERILDTTFDVDDDEWTPELTEQLIDHIQDQLRVLRRLKADYRAHRAAGGDPIPFLED